MHVLVGLVLSLFTLGSFSSHLPNWTMFAPIVISIVVGLLFRTLLKVAVIAVAIGIFASYVLHVPFPHF